MITRSCALALVLVGMSAPALLAPGVAAPPRKASTRRAAPAAAPADNRIIPLPLTPTVSAAQRLCANRTPSGLGYTMLRPASGPKPAGTDTVLVNYLGYLAATGSVFDQGTQSPLPVGGVIKGFAEGLQMLSRTGVVRLCIPAALGYGAEASGPIPASSDLVFQVELLDFKTAAELDGLRGQSATQTPAQKDPPPQP